MNDDKTRVIGREEFRGDYENEYRDPLAREVDELAFLDEMSVRQQPQEWNEEYDDYEEPEQPRRGNRSGKKKKKSKAGLIIAIIVIIAAIAGGAIWVLTSGDGEVIPTDEGETIELDLGATVQEPKVTGFDGEGVLGDITLNQDAVNQVVNGIEIEEQKAQVKTFFENVEYVADKTDGLSAGDKITITADYDEILAKDANISVTNGTYILTVGTMEEKAKVEMPQWFRHVEKDGDELIVTCLLLAKAGTSMDLPIGFMYACEGGAFSELIDTSGKPDITYGGIDYYMEPGCESPYGSVSEVDDSHINYGVTLFDDSYSISVNYTINDDGTITVDTADGGETPVQIGVYEPISPKAAKKLGGYIH